MAPLPTYQPRPTLPGNLGATLQPVAPADLSGQAAGYKAQGAFGNELVNVGVKLYDAQQKSDATRALTEYVTELDALETELRNADYRTGPEEFARRHEELLKAKSSKIFDNTLRDATTLEMTRAGITAGRRVRERALTDETDANKAMLDTHEQLDLREASTAGTTIDRQTAVDRVHRRIDEAATSGWITNVEGVARKQRFARYIDQADISRDIRTDPFRALQRLEDPNNYPSIDPVTRQSWINQAQSETEKFSQVQVAHVARTNPARAIGITGRTAGPRSTDAIFDAGIMPTENATGDNTAVSPKGAIGKSQILPSTAREVLGGLDGATLVRVGLTPERRAELLKLDERGFGQALKDDAGLNVALGRDYWRQMNERYQGRVWLAAAGYNAGPGKTDEWVAEANKRFGPTFTDQQFLQVVNYKETRDYIGRLGRHIGVDPSVGNGLTPRGGLTTSVTVESVLGQDERDETRAIKAVAKIARDTDDPATVFKAGYDVDPGQYNAWSLKQQQAAAHGDEAAAKALREAEFQRTLLPHKRAALSMSPAELEATIAAGEAGLRASGNASPDQVRQLAVFKEVFENVKTARKDNIIGLAEQSGLVPADRRSVIDPAADPGSEDFRAALAVRGAIAEHAATRWQGDAVALKPQELAGLKQRWSQAGADERFKLIEGMGAALSGRAYDDTLAAVIGDDPTSAYVGKLARTNPQLAREILAGAELMKAKEVGDKSAVVRPALAAKLGGQLYPSPAMQDQVLNAALALYTSRRGREGTLYDATDQAGIEKAIDDVAGPIVKQGGQRVPTGALGRAGFTDAVGNLEAADLALFGGARGYSPAEISRYAVFKPLEIGGTRYVVGIPDPASRDGFKAISTLSEAGAPLIVDLRVIADRQRRSMRFGVPDPGAMMP